MALSANGQRIENADALEINSGGAANPSVESGIDDPTSIGQAAAEGSLYMRHVPTAGEIYLKTGVTDTDWTQVIVGSASVSLDQAYDTGRVVTADSGPVEINNNVSDTTACLKLQRIPGSSSAAPVLDIDAGSNATGTAVDILSSNVACRGLTIGSNAAVTVPVLSISASGGLGAGGSCLNINQSGTGNAASYGINLSLGASAAGTALNISHAGSGKAIVADNDVDITGILKLDGAQRTTVIPLADAASIATNAALGNIFEVTLGGNRTLANPTNLDDGTYIWIITQDGTGSRTLAYDTLFKFPGGITPVLTTDPGAIDVLTAIYDGTNLLTTFQSDFS